MDHAAIHLLSAIYSVARNITAHRSTDELILSSELTDQLFNYINLGLQRNLQTNLPKKSDRTLVNQIREACEQNWQDHNVTAKINLFELLSIYASEFKNWLFKRSA